MDLEKKINMLGRIMADVQKEVKLMSIRQKEIKDLLLDPNKLDAARYLKKFYEGKNNKEIKGDK